MPRGGKRPGAGRKPSSLTEKTREIAELVINDGLTPLEVMAKAMRLYAAIAEAEPKPHLAAIAWTRAAEIAKDCAPYMHPKLASVEHTGRDGAALVPARVEVVFVGTK